MHLAIQTPQISCEVDDLVAVWQAADRLGFRSGWLMDHLEPITAPDTEPILEAWTTLAVLLRATSRLRGGVLVTPNTFRPPSVLARMAATIDRASNGRLEVGLGAAWCAWEHERNGLVFPSVKDRLDLLDESCRALRLLWTEPIANFDGAHVRLAGARCQPKPIQQPLPILIGGRGERRTLRIVAEHADRWNGAGSPAMLATSVAALQAHCEAIGRPFDQIDLTVRNDFHLAHNAADATAALERIGAFGKLSIEETRERNFVGGVDELVDRIGAFAAMGFAEALLCFDPPYDERTIETLEVVAAEIMPAVASPRGGAPG
jgi:alkanesulfonate monooxygenase SsuD/methylene tetrahydromethanopterin reductase-like flavin-dependent oxidoreductase (luciferase family)